MLWPASLTQRRRTNAMFPRHALWCTKQGGCHGSGEAGPQGATFRGPRAAEEQGRRVCSSRTGRQVLPSCPCRILLPAPPSVLDAACFLPLSFAPPRYFSFPSLHANTCSLAFPLSLSPALSLSLGLSPSVSLRLSSRLPPTVSPWLWLPPSSLPPSVSLPGSPAVSLTGSRSRSLARILSRYDLHRTPHENKRRSRH